MTAWLPKNAILSCFGCHDLLNLHRVLEGLRSVMTEGKPRWRCSAVAGLPIPTGANPVSNATADVNGDGHLDLLVTNYITDNVSVLLGDGDGHFTPTTAPVPVVNGPREIEAGDLDGDGDIDFIAANYSGNNVSVLLNNGSGGFTAATPVPVGTTPRYVALGDFDGDGDLDFVAGNYISNNISVMLNNGSGGFVAGPLLVGVSRPVGVVLGDFDGDLDLDIAVANNNTNNVSILFNGVAPTVTIPVGTGPRGIAAGDLDGDGDLDLAVANFGANTVSILLNNGSGGFTAGAPVATGNNPYAVAVGDLDGDGDRDIAVTNSGGSSITVLINNGLAGFTPASGSPFGVGVSPGGIVMGDFDEDGDLDLSNVNFGSNTASVLLNTAAFYSVTATNQVVEGTPPGGGGEIVFTVSRNATSEAEDVIYSLGGSATAGTDYVAVSGTASFAVGQSIVEIRIAVTPDATVEFDETVTVTLLGASGAGVINPAAFNATGLIDNDDFVFIIGTRNDDVIDGTPAGTGQVFPSEFDDFIKGRAGDDKLLGLGGDDVLSGGSGRDRLFGGAGDDRLIGGLGNNLLKGGEGDDIYVFGAKLQPGPPSLFGTITGFNVGDDTIELSHAIFRKLALGPLSDAAFRDVGEKVTSQTRITYKANGELSYDRDGKGPADAVLFAKLVGHPDIDVSDFLVVA